jgi:hypothetical protein
MTTCCCQTSFASEEDRKKLALSKYHYVISVAYGFSKSSVSRMCPEANTWKHQNVAVFSSARERFSILKKVTTLED